MNWWFFRVSLLIAAVLCGSGGNNRPNQVDKSLVVLFTILILEYFTTVADRRHCTAIQEEDSNIKE